MINSGSRLDSIYFQFFFMFRFIVELLKMWVKIPERLSYPNPRFYERKTCMHFKVSVISNYHKTLLWWLTFAFYLKYGFIGDSQLNNIYFKERFSCGFIIASHFFNISRGFNFANWLPMDFWWGFTLANLKFINVLYILIFSRFVLQLVVCGSRNSQPNFSIFWIALLWYKRLNSRETFFLCFLLLSDLQ